MGVSIDPKTRIAGYTPGVIKAALRRLPDTDTPRQFLDLSLFAHRRDGAIVYEECVSRGLINPKTYDLTEAGHAFASAKVVKRTKRAAAQAILDSFIANIHELNTSENPLLFVDQIWLFGSLMRAEDTVGDIDIALTYRMNAYDDLRAFIQTMLKRYPEAPKHFSGHLGGYQWLIHRAIFGPRRHPLLSGARIDDGELKDLAVPCQLVYDLARGGRVDDAILDRHPDAGERSKDIEKEQSVPDLTPGPLLPLHGAWITDCDDTGHVSPYPIFRGWTTNAHDLFPGYPPNLRAITHSAQAPWRLKFTGIDSIDGRDKTVFINGTSDFATMLSRKITQTPKLWTIEAAITDREYRHSSALSNFNAINEIASAMALLVAVDAERLVRRAREEPGQPAVAIAVKENSDVLINETLVARLFHLLESRTIMIDPPGYPSVIITKR